MDERKQEIADALANINKLPRERRDAIFWIVDHAEIAEALTAPEPVADELLESYIQAAKKEAGFLICALLIYRQIRQRRDVALPGPKRPAG